MASTLLKFASHGQLPSCHQGSHRTPLLAVTSAAKHLPKRYSSCSKHTAACSSSVSPARGPNANEWQTGWRSAITECAKCAWTTTVVLASAHLLYSVALMVGSFCLAVNFMQTCLGLGVLLLQPLWLERYCSGVLCRVLWIGGNHGEAKRFGAGCAGTDTWLKQCGQVHLAYTVQCGQVWPGRTGKASHINSPFTQPTDPTNPLIACIRTVAVCRHGFSSR